MTKYEHSPAVYINQRVNVKHQVQKEIAREGREGSTAKKISRDAIDQIVEAQLQKEYSLKGQCPKCHTRRSKNGQCFCFD
jgi:GTPase Era involved in 16S rRNA processing